MPNKLESIANKDMITNTKMSSTEDDSDLLASDLYYVFLIYLQHRHVAYQIQQLRQRNLKMDAICTKNQN